MTSPQVTPIRRECDIEQARRDAVAVASSLGFGAEARYTLALVVSELGTNLVRYSRDGELTIGTVSGPSRTEMQIVSQDRGPGIEDVDRALRDGCSSGGGLGSGLPAVRRLANAFAIRSGPEGTWIEARIWD